MSVFRGASGRDLTGLDETLHKVARVCYLNSRNQSVRSENLLDCIPRNLAPFSKRPWPMDTMVPEVKYFSLVLYRPTALRNRLATPSQAVAGLAAIHLTRPRYEQAVARRAVYLSINEGLRMSSRMGARATGRNTSLSTTLKPAAWNNKHSVAKGQHPGEYRLIALSASRRRLARRRLALSCPPTILRAIVRPAWIKTFNPSPEQACTLWTSKRTSSSHMWTARKAMPGQGVPIDGHGKKRRLILFDSPAICASNRNARVIRLGTGDLVSVKMTPEVMASLRAKGVFGLSHFIGLPLHDGPTLNARNAGACLLPFTIVRTPTLIMNLWHIRRARPIRDRARTNPAGRLRQHMSLIFRTYGERSTLRSTLRVILALIPFDQIVRAPTPIIGTAHQRRRVLLISIATATRTEAILFAGARLKGLLALPADANRQSDLYLRLCAQVFAACLPGRAPTTGATILPVLSRGRNLEACSARFTNTCPERLSACRTIPHASPCHERLLTMSTRLGATRWTVRMPTVIRRQTFIATTADAYHAIRPHNKIIVLTGQYYYSAESSVNDIGYPMGRITRTARPRPIIVGRS